ncbi:MAG TPA: ABC-2 family transporter protein [Candidatus Ozemobacteraceae bacterium]|nr:ABC-2 family transporter protein [Candidatus Ozemobacteraceae bacterium]
MRRHTGIILQFWKAHLVQALEYRTSFAFGIIANGLDFVFGLLQYCLFFTVADAIADWDMPRMLAFYAVFMTIFSLHFILLYPNLDAIGRFVNTGQLDLVLTKPVSPQALLSFRSLSFEEFGSLLAALGLLAWLLASGRIAFSPTRMLMFVIAIACSLSLIYCMFLFFMSLAIRIEKIQNMSELLWSVFSLCRYPADIYPRAARWVFYVVLPIAFVTTVPARAISAGEAPEILLLGCALTVTLVAASVLFWRRSLAGYTSAGG